MATTGAASDWQTFQQVFAKIYPLLASKKKPIIIGEMASAEQGGDKGKWIDAMIPVLKAQYPLFKAVVWFDIDKENDWRINSSTAALAAFSKMATDSELGPRPRYLMKADSAGPITFAIFLIAYVVVKGRVQLRCRRERGRWRRPRGRDGGLGRWRRRRAPAVVAQRAGEEAAAPQGAAPGARRAQVGPASTAPSPDTGTSACAGLHCGALCNSCPPSAPLCPGAVAYCDANGVSLSSARRPSVRDATSSTYAFWASGGQGAGRTATHLNPMSAAYASTPTCLVVHARALPRARRRSRPMTLARSAFGIEHHSETLPIMSSAP